MKFKVGQSHRESLKVDETAIKGFADFSGDRNPIHLDPLEAKSYGYSRQVAHGGILIAMLSRVVGMEIPGPGAVIIGQSVKWVAPVLMGDQIDMRVTVANVSASLGVLSLDVQADNQRGERVMNGEVEVKVAERILKKEIPEPTKTRVALVTGGSRGIGAAVSRRLGSAGFAVAVNYLNSETSALEVVTDVKAAGGQAIALSGDLAEPERAGGLAEAVIQEFGRLDVVIHGASPNITPIKVKEMSYQDVRSYLDIYLGSGVQLVSAAAPGMTERGFGRFIFLGTSFMFGQPPDGMAPYVIAKEALWGLVKSMAAELGPFGITANMVSPGITETDLTAYLPARFKEVQARTNPSRRLATTDDTGEFVNFLASDASGFINGANLPVAGGPQ